jgi:hypothetical protein
VTFDEAAELLHMPPYVLRLGLRYGFIDVPFARTGGTRVFSRKALTEWLAEKNATRTDPPTLANHELLKKPIGELTVAELDGFIAALGRPAPK